MKECVESIGGIYRDLRIEQPIYSCLTMLRCYGWELAVSLGPDSSTIDLYVLEFPPILFEDPSSNTIDELQIWFDRLWNAVNLTRCPLYDPDTGKADLKRLQRV